MKLGVCVPYRNREAHLKEFIPTIGDYLKKNGIPYHIYFAHQKDDKLFNRGVMKNIAAEHAFKDGCDYIVWHDIDMIPEKDDCDYSYPTEHPVHIAVKISQSNYKLKYQEYFGGAVLFTKEHVERTNGYSNDYWDWGMEDDDLFWRCVNEGYVNQQYLPTLPNQRYATFNGNNSGIVITDHPFEPNKSHTTSVLCRVYQQPTKNPIFLIGDKNKKYIEYPIVRVPGYDYGISFNNSRAISFQFWDDKHSHQYMWGKRYESQWTWVTTTVDVKRKEARLFINGVEINDELGEGSPSPHTFNTPLKKYNNPYIYLGSTPSVPSYDTSKYMKGDISKLQIWERVLSHNEIKKIHTTPPNDFIVDVDFNKNYTFHQQNIEYNREDIQIPISFLPHRKVGTFKCLPHEREGLIDDGEGNLKWKRGETTARNERKLILDMQSGKEDYKKDGMNSLKYELLSVDTITPNSTMINVKL
jgi:hypothetical protein